MKKKITKSLSFCFALVLMLSMFSMAAAAAGILIHVNLVFPIRL